MPLRSSRRPRGRTRASAAPTSRPSSASFCAVAPGQHQLVVARRLAATIGRSLRGDQPPGEAGGAVEQDLVDMAYAPRATVQCRSMDALHHPGQHRAQEADGRGCRPRPAKQRSNSHSAAPARPAATERAWSMAPVGRRVRAPTRPRRAVRARARLGEETLEPAPRRGRRVRSAWISISVRLPSSRSPSRLLAVARRRLPG